MKYKVGDKVLYTCEDGLSEPIEAVIYEVSSRKSSVYPYIVLHGGGTTGNLACDAELSLLEPEQLRQREQFFNDIEEKPPTKGELHRQICESLNKTYIRKNTDYGDSYGQLRKKYPDSILIRLFDKFSRLERLISGHEAQIKDESIEDTLLDMANYALMEVVERRLSK